MSSWLASPDLPAPGAGGGGGLGAEEAGLHPLLPGAWDVLCWVEAVTQGTSANLSILKIVKLRQGSGKDRQGMAVKAKGLKAQTLA